MKMCWTPGSTDPLPSVWLGFTVFGFRFSSGIFPISIFNWPDEEDKEYQQFYPGHLLETGYTQSA
jgi:hypothetical protein